MNIRPLLSLTLALSCFGCAATAPPVHDLDIEATAVVVHPGFDVFTISGAHDDIDAARAAAEAIGQRQILVDAKIHGDGTVQCPKVLMLESQPATLFVGSCDEEGNEDGLYIEVAVDGDTATLDARELVRGETVARRALTIPVTAPSE